MKKHLLFVFLFLVTLAASAQPDPSKIPHYFGPYPNWANSPITTVDATIELLDGCGGAGAGATAVASVNVNGAITGVTVTSQGSGYTCAPNVSLQTTYGSGAALHTTLTPSTGYVSGITLLNPGADYFAPVVTITGNGTGATADATTDPYTGAITGITLTNPGTGYTTVGVTITDDGGTGTGATASATASSAVISVLVDSPGSGYRTPGGIRKFVDGLPGLGPGGVNNLGQYVSVAHPDTITYPGSDYYVIALVQYTKKLHSDLAPTKIRGYVQLNNGTDGSGHNTIVPDAPQYLGATIVAHKGRPVRILFKNQLPTGAGGNLFLPVDATMMGAGMGPDMGGMTETNSNSVYDGVRNPMCGMMGTKPMGCYTENRATLHLHGGTTPWISDGTPHQWTAPAGEATSYPRGVSVSFVPDMWFDVSGAVIASCAGQTTCNVAGATNDPGNGALTFYYTNQQSARLLFYHDHAWGITRLNVLVGEAAGYLITDDTEGKLMAPGAALDASDPALGLGIPLVIQDRTFVPSAAQLAVQDPTWDSARWGGPGNFWYHHVYMTAQNPADPTGSSPYGRWMYGPWFWPPALLDTTPYQPIPNPYYVAGCDPATAPDGFCEPPLIPGTPNISVGMEQFNDTPMVNGTPYPTVTLEPKAYRFRLLNAANDRFFNLQWYVADSSGTEVALKASEVAAAQNDPTVYPTPDTTLSPVGPSWLQIGSEGGFLPTPVVIPNQPITWITDATRFDAGNVDQHAMLIAPAERADVVVDFSKYAGKTLILYNDSPAAFPARQASYDYYTGDPDNSDIGGAPTTVPGFGPNTRTIMQVKIAASTTIASKFSLSKLVTAFQHHADGSGVFESGQHPIIIGQAAYNRALGTNFTTAGDCSAPGSTIKCDGFARIIQQGGDPFTFDTLSGAKLALPIQPKALHDEMNSATFDEYGRMTANLGVEATPATAAAQSIVLYPYVNPATEVIDGTKLQSAASPNITPIATADDGTQIWKITHNGVDTHPIHFHLFDVQVIDRVTWDNIIMPPDANELGWKDTVRTSPLQDTYVALRPVVPSVPFEIPNSIRPLNPMLPIGSSMGFNSTGLDGNATSSNIINEVVNFGWEYVWHCHILSHEEMDMMRPMSLAVPPSTPGNLMASLSGTGINLTWNNTKSATGYTVQRASDTAFLTNLVSTPVGLVNTYGDSTPASANYYYRVFATNTVGSTAGSGFTTSPGGNSFPTITVNSGYSNTASAPVATISVSAYNFGNSGVGVPSAAHAFSVSNLSGVAIPLSGIAAAGNFTISSATCGATLAAKSTCSFNVVFTPSALGLQSATMNVKAGVSALPLALSGTGVAAGVSITRSSIAFGTFGVGTSSAAVLVGVYNNTAGSLALSGIATTSDFVVSGSTCGATLGSGRNCGFYVTFTPTLAGARAATMNISVGATVLPLSLSGTGVGAAVSISRSSLAFGNVGVGTSVPTSVSVTNNSPGTVAVSGIASTGQFIASGNTCTATLASNASCSFTVSFAPSSLGAKSATMNVVAGGTPLPVAMTGTGVAATVTLTRTSIAFGTIKVGLSSAQVLVGVYNNTGSSVALSGIATTGNFVVSGSTCTATLAANRNCGFYVTFTPTSIGAKSGTMNIVGGATALPLSLTGTGN